MKKEKETFQQFCDPVLRRAEQMKVKSEAVWKIFLELDGLINVSKFAKLFFNKSHSWFLQRLNGYDVNHKRAEFTAEEYARIASSFRELANRLNTYAEEIDNAKIMEDLRTVRVFIEQGADGTFSAYMPDENNLSYGVIGEGETFETAKQDFIGVYEAMREAAQKRNQPFEEVEFNFMADPN